MRAGAVTSKGSWWAKTAPHGPTGIGRGQNPSRFADLSGPPECPPFKARPNARARSHGLTDFDPLPRLPWRSVSSRRWRTSPSNVAIDREKLLQSAAKFAEKKKYDKAIAEYRRIVESDPTDTRTMLKIGDLQSRMLDFQGAIQTYNQVAEQYAKDGFFLKAIAVYKQIRELIKKHAPELATRFSHVTPRLADIYAKLNLTSDALTAYDEVATQLQKAGKDREAVEIFKKTVTLDPMNPLPHLRLAEASCKVQDVDGAVQSFWTAAELLLTLERPDDALKVIERILHFRTTSRFARAAAELYLKRNDQQGGMQALAKLQIAFQSDPKDLDTLALLAQAFEVIGQPDKSLAVHIEMARLAREQNKRELLVQILEHLAGVAPHNPEVVALTKLGLPQPSIPAPPAPAAPLPRPFTSPRPQVVELDVEPEPEEILDAQSIPPGPIPDDDLRSFDPPAARSPSVRPQPVDLDADLEYVDDQEQPPSGIPVHDDSVPISEFRNFDVVESRAPGTPESFHASAHAHKAIVDAESFRRLGLLDKAVEALHIALEIDPNSVPIREKLREILVDAGERDAAIQETINIAIIHLHNQEPDLAEPLVLEVLEIEPNHQDAHTLLYHVSAQREAQASVSSDGHLNSFDLEGVRPSSALNDIPGDAPLPHFPLDEEDLGRLERRTARPSPEAIEEVLEEAEFFAAQGLYVDAEAILEDTLRLAPDHVLLRERLTEIRADRALSEVQGPPSSLGPTDHSFDIAATLDALDDLDGPKRPKLDTVSQEVDVDQVFAKFKEGVKATVDESDASTHFDLGVAYREMGLLADAIGEFEIAARDPARFCTCQGMIGLIEKQMGNLPRARAAFERALEAEKKSPEQEKGLLYDLALVAEALGDHVAYQNRLRQLARLDGSYKDVATRLANLGASPSVAPDDDLEAAFDHLLG